MSNRSLTMMNQDGDLTMIWDGEADAEMERIIAEKMKQGVTFFIVEPRFFGLLPPKRTELAKAKDANKHRALSVRDDDLAALVQSGAVSVVKGPDAPVKSRGRAKSAKEAATNHTVSVQPKKGG